MSSTPSITEAEWKVMRLLWAQAPQPAYDLIQNLQKTEGWHANTVRTILSRLHAKKAVTAKRYKNLYLYSPAITREQCIQSEGDSFLERVFGGSVTPLLLHFAKRHRLSEAEIEELKGLLERAER